VTPGASPPIPITPVALFATTTPIAPAACAWRRLVDEGTRPLVIERDLAGDAEAFVMGSSVLGGVPARLRDRCASTRMPGPGPSGDAGAEVAVPIV
jgi:hypothetical protein